MNLIPSDLDGWYNLLQILFLLFSVLGGVYAWSSRSYKSFKKLKDSVDFIAKELKPNSGTSLRDAVDGVKKSSQRTEMILQEIDQRLASVELAQKVYIDIDSQVPIFQTDVKGSLVWANKAFVNFVRIPLNELSGHGWQTIIEQSERDKVRKEWDLAISENRVFEYCFRIFIDNSAQTVKCRAVGCDHGGYIAILTEIEQDNC